jgi:signal transduction histidine kinase
MKLYSLSHSNEPKQPDSVDPQADRVNVISHEMRTPLAIISGYAQVLREEVDASQKELVEPILENVERLNQVIASMIDWEASQVVAPVATQDCDVRHLVQTVIDLVRPSIGNKELSIHLVADEIEVVGDISAESLRAGLKPVLENAIKFSEKGTINVRLDADSSRIRIRVEDEGQGIQGDGARLFEPFIQESAGLNRLHEGLGLGLALAQQGITRLKGTISLANKSHGNGAVAEITFPRMARQEAKKRPVYGLRGLVRPSGRPVASKTDQKRAA